MGFIKYSIGKITDVFKKSNDEELEELEELENELEEKLKNELEELEEN